MKKILLAAIAVASMMTAQANEAFEVPKASDTWSIGLDGGVGTPMRDRKFAKDMRGMFGLHIQKNITPTFALGIEGLAGVNTSSWTNESIGGIHRHTAIDNIYAGVYGSVNLMNLFGSYNCDGRFFDIDAVAGIGWGRYCGTYAQFETEHQNFMATRVGLNFNFNVTKRLTISLKPGLMWNMTGSAYHPLDVEQSTAAYNAKLGTITFLAGVTYRLGRGYVCTSLQDNSEIDALNARVNELRGVIDGGMATLNSLNAQCGQLDAQLQACRNRKPEVKTVVEESNTLSSVRYVFYGLGSSVITADQRPNVEMVAQYLKSHKNAKVLVKGYASKDGNYDFNVKLANARAQAVKDMLVKKYGIKADRIVAEGQGIGEMFSEESWNRVAICTLED